MKVQSQDESKSLCIALFILCIAQFHFPSSLMPSLLSPLDCNLLEGRGCAFPLLSTSILKEPGVLWALNRILLMIVMFLKMSEEKADNSGLPGFHLLILKYPLSFYKQWCTQAAYRQESVSEKQFTFPVPLCDSFNALGICLRIYFKHISYAVSQLHKHKIWFHSLLLQASHS